MSHFAKVIDGIVTEVLVIEQDVINTGLFGALIEQKTVEWVSCGHDHDNDFWGTYQGMKLAYGRKTGFGCYGPDFFKRGARVFEVT